jgi:hypothetical protein
MSIKRAGRIARLFCADANFPQNIFSANVRERITNFSASWPTARGCFHTLHDAAIGGAWLKELKMKVGTEKGELFEEGERNDESYRAWKKAWERYKKALLAVWQAEERLASAKVQMDAAEKLNMVLNEAMYGAMLEMEKQPPLPSRYGN